MKIIICGAGEVGSHAADVLAGSGQSITVIDTEVERLAKVEDEMDVATLAGNCASGRVLREAGTARASLVLAATDSDEVNLLTAATAKAIGAKRVLARVHHRAYFEQRGFDYARHLGIDGMICPEHATALAIAGALRNPGVVAVENFARGGVEMQEFRVDDHAPALGKPLESVSMPRGTRVASVFRKQYAFMPDASTVLEAGDNIILVGNSDVFEEARKLFHKEERRRQRAVIMGGPTMAVWLARTLRDLNFAIRIFEAQRERAEELASKLEWVSVIEADPTDPTVFEEEHIAQADVFLALTDDDEHNILGCAWAKTMGINRAIAVVQKPNYLHLLPHVGIDEAFSPRVVAVREIEALIDERPLRRIATLVEGILDVYQIRIGEKAVVLGQPLREATLTSDSLIAAVPEGDGFRLPGPDDVLAAGDMILVIGRHALDQKLAAIFDCKLS